MVHKLKSNIWKRSDEWLFFSPPYLSIFFPPPPLPHAPISTSTLTHTPTATATATPPVCAKQDTMRVSEATAAFCLAGAGGAAAFQSPWVVGRAAAVAGGMPGAGLQQRGAATTSSSR